MMDIEQAVSRQILDGACPAAIVVGTGRCGSTMISNILRTHSDVLSLSEFFCMQIGAKLAQEPLDAAQFWDIMATPKLDDTLFLKTGITADEILYPYSSTSRFTAETGIPPILVTSLPHITDDYEALFDELQQLVSQFPRATLDVHYARLFAWLKQRFSRKTVIERTGTSLMMVAELAQLFPSTKFVHIIRNGLDCALSMSRHGAFYYMAYIEIVMEELGFGSRLLRGGSEFASAEMIPPHLLDPDRIRTRLIPLEIFGRFWSQTYIFGVEALLQLPAERVLALYYEDFLSAPQHTITRMMNFIDPTLCDQTWVEYAAQIVHPNPPAREQLSADALASLQLGCRPGLEVLDLITHEGMQSPRLPTLLQHLRNSSMDDPLTQ